jgi:hypothetical protein
MNIFFIRLYPQLLKRITSVVLVFTKWNPANLALTLISHQGQNDRAEIWIHKAFSEGVE